MTPGSKNPYMHKPHVTFPQHFLYKKWAQAVSAQWAWESRRTVLNMMQPIISSFLRRFLLVVAFTAIILISGLPVSKCAAATVKWVGASGDWSDASKWSGGSLPGAGDDVLIDMSNGDITVTI